MTTTKGQATNLTETLTHTHTTTPLGPVPADAPLLTTEQVARALAVDPNTVRRWIKDGGLEGVKAGRSWRVHPSELRAFIDRNTRRSTPLTTAGAR